MRIMDLFKYKLKLLSQVLKNVIFYLENIELAEEYQELLSKLFDRSYWYSFYFLPYQELLSICCSTYIRTNCTKIFEIDKGRRKKNYKLRTCPYHFEALPRTVKTVFLRTPPKNSFFLTFSDMHIKRSKTVWNESFWKNVLIK